MTIQQYQKALKKLGKEVFLDVMAKTVTQTATYAHNRSITFAKQRLTIRNNYSLSKKNQRLYKATAKKGLLKINAITGNMLDYMALQDGGGEAKPKSGKKAVSLGGLASRGGNKKKAMLTRYKRTSVLTKNQFIGKPKGSKALPFGLYERYADNKKIRLIKDLSKDSIRVDPTHWHSDAMKIYGTKSMMEKIFIKVAEKELALF